MLAIRQKPNVRTQKYPQWPFKIAKHYSRHQLKKWFPANYTSYINIDYGYHGQMGMYLILVPIHTLHRQI